MISSTSAAASSLLARTSKKRLPFPNQFITSTTTTRRSLVSVLTKPHAPLPQQQKDLDHAVHLVKSHDPAGYFPGRLLPSAKMQLAYYAVRGFWVETGLRFGTTALVPPNSPPSAHLDWWTQGIETIYDSSNLPKEWDHPTLRLLHSLLQQETDLSKCHFEDILKGRRRDLDLKQYPTLESLKEHAVLSCGSLGQLVLESGDIRQISHPSSHQAAKHIGMCHGLTNALRTSIPVISTTGKLVIPQELCVKYSVKSPRYLLSALGQGDAECVKALQSAVRDIAMEAREELTKARSLRQTVETEDPEALAVLLPGFASETFLNRLEQFGYDLTDPDLRRVSWIEHAKCSMNMMVAAYQKRY
jgi:phytoene/squalene synthetase